MIKRFDPIWLLKKVWLDVKDELTSSSNKQVSKVILRSEFEAGPWWAQKVTTLNDWELINPPIDQGSS